MRYFHGIYCYAAKLASDLKQNSLTSQNFQLRRVIPYRTSNKVRQVYSSSFFILKLFQNFARFK